MKNKKEKNINKNPKLFDFNLYFFVLDFNF